MRKIPALLLITLGLDARSQYWEACGLGTIGPTSVQTIYGDSVSDRLLAGGTFLRMLNQNDTVLGVGQAAWNGFRWDTLAHRIQTIGGNISAQPTFWFLRFQNSLYACGRWGFETDEGHYNGRLARLNETSQHWEALECTNGLLSGLQTLVPKQPQGTLYATGYIGDVCGYPQSCVFRYDGGAFHIWEPYDLIPYDANNYVGYIFDFQGMTYMSGSYRDPLSSGSSSLMRYNGGAWEYVPGWNTLFGIKDLSIRNDTLYVAGAFRMATGGPGDLVAYFDGTNWNTMGGGLSHPTAPASGAALDLEWFHDELYACGLFHDAAGVPVDGIAKWNGQQWCGLPGSFEGYSSDIVTLNDMAVWRDELYVCGGFNSLDGNFGIRSVAKWIGGDATTNCSPPVGVAETEVPPQRLRVYADPVEEELFLRDVPAGTSTCTVRDLQGRICSAARWTGRSMAVGGLAQGTYVITATDATGRSLASTRFVKR